jgi:arylsulfatase A-like enzyme
VPHVGAESVLREYVLPDLSPAVVFNWLTEPDGTQHALGAGAPEAIETIRNDDRNIGLILDKLTALGLAEFTNIFVVSDHGFSVHTFAVNVAQALIGAGLKAASDSDDVVLTSSGQAVLLHVKNHDPQRIRAVVEFLQVQEWAGVLFTESRHSDWERDPFGWVPGTFSLQLIHMSTVERGPDILLTFPWTSDKNAFGAEGTDFTITNGATGPVTSNSSGHGSMSPWTVRNTFFAWGVDFKNSIAVRVPASNVDVTPTILALMGVTDPEVREGRVLVEALEGGPDEETVPVKTRVFVTETAHYSASIQVSVLDGQAPYIDKSWRTR